MRYLIFLLLFSACTVKVDNPTPQIPQQTPIEFEPDPEPNPNPEPPDIEPAPQKECKIQLNWIIPAYYWNGRPINPNDLTKYFIWVRESDKEYIKVIDAHQNGRLITEYYLSFKEEGNYCFQVAVRDIYGTQGTLTNSFCKRCLYE